MDKPPRPGDLVTVYELVNDSRRELYIGTTWRLQELQQLQQITRPRAVSHWGPEEKVRFRVVEYSLPLREAQAFMENYAASQAVQALGYRRLPNAK